MTKIVAYLATIAKFLAAAGGAVAVAVSLGLLSGDAQKWVTGGLAVATAFVVYLVRNAPAPAPAPAPFVALTANTDEFEAKMAAARDALPKPPDAPPVPPA